MHVRHHAGQSRQMRPMASAGHALRARRVLVMLSLAMTALVALSGIGVPGLAQDASPVASPQATPVLATPASATGPTTMVIVGEVTIEITDDNIVPIHFESAVGRDVTITVVNHGSRMHTFTMEDFEIDLELDPGESETFTLEQPQIGTYTYSSEGANGETLEGTMTVFI